MEISELHFGTFYVVLQDMDAIFYIPLWKCLRALYLHLLDIRHSNKMVECKSSALGSKLVVTLDTALHTSTQVLVWWPGNYCVLKWN